MNRPTVRAPFSVHARAGYGRTAWQVRDANGFVVGRLIHKANADEVARLLNAGVEAAP